MIGQFGLSDRDGTHCFHSVRNIIFFLAQGTLIKINQSP